MCVNKCITSLNLFIFFIKVQSAQQLSFNRSYNDIDKGISELINNTQHRSKTNINPILYQMENELSKRSISKRQSIMLQDENIQNVKDVVWSKINEEVDMVIPMILEHLQKLGIEYLNLPDINESITLSPIVIKYQTGLFLSNGIIYNIAGIERYKDAYMTYRGKSFLSKFYLKIKDLQFDYNFVIKLMAIDGYGKILGSLEDTIIYTELAVNIVNTKFTLIDFRIMGFKNIHVQLDQSQIIRQLSGLILSPITNLFKAHITSSISDGLKNQMQMLMDDFNGEDPLQLRKFTKQLLTSLTG